MLVAESTCLQPRFRGCRRTNDQQLPRPAGSPQKPLFRGYKVVRPLSWLSWSSEELISHYKLISFQLSATSEQWPGTGPFPGPGMPRGVNRSPIPFNFTACLLSHYHWGREWSRIGHRCSTLPATCLGPIAPLLHECPATPSMSLGSAHISRSQFSLDPRLIIILYAHVPPLWSYYDQ